jgi:branched-chain amino acid transport system ATP-binding protein
MNALLRMDKVTVRFGGLVAVSEVDFHVDAGELVGLIGPNGAGKTTLFNVITGVYAPSSGSVAFAGEQVGGEPPFKITARGIARTFQNIRLFASLTVSDNVVTALNLHSKNGFFSALWRGGAFQAEEAHNREEARKLLEIFGLSNVAHAPCRSLSYGDQRRLEIVRALATKPRLLLLDEPAAGMNPTEKVELMKLIRFIRERFNLAVLLVEHDMKVVMGICERVAVLEYGCKIAEGTPTEIQKDRRVIAAYLGEEVSNA